MDTPPQSTEIYRSATLADLDEAWEQNDCCDLEDRKRIVFELGFRAGEKFLGQILERIYRLVHLPDAPPDLAYKDPTAQAVMLALRGRVVQEWSQSGKELMVKTDQGQPIDPEYLKWLQGQPIGHQLPENYPQ